MAAPDDIVLAGVEDGIAGILLNRPDSDNAWSPEMADAFHDALDEAAADDDVRAIVVTGAGGAFCTTELRPVPPADRRRRSPLHPLSIGKPIVAAINGPCSGMGFAEALLCDVRFAAQSATLCAPYARRGLPLPDAMAWVLPRVAGMGGALDAVLSAREIGATEAMRLGLVQGVFPDGELTERVLAYAGQIASRTDADASAAIKAQVYRSMEMGLAQAIDDAALLRSRFVD
ncbi:MAG TPA: enoyl-CoA hydratase-related protein [Acidimicrobiales bacterium]|jgi:enoyl-CoA hydratase/carnithine racemase|nr:enoyl-CoA hydratase-related protein [Acidimicrobiales bacterium]